VIKHRIYIDWYGNFLNYTDDYPKVYLDWYKHSDRHKYKGFTFTASILGYVICLNFVNNGIVYRKSLARWDRRKL